MCRANIQMLAERSTEPMSDIEQLYVALPEPVDQQVDAGTQMLYWTEHAEIPQSNTQRS